MEIDWFETLKYMEKIVNEIEGKEKQNRECQGKENTRKLEEFKEASKELGEFCMSAINGFMESGLDRKEAFSLYCALLKNNMI